MWKLSSEWYLTQSDRRLLQLLILPQPKQEQLEQFLAAWDIEEEGANRGLLLACYRAEQPQLVFSDYVAPRLEGLLRFFRFRNMPLLAELHQVVRGFANQNIRYAVIRDGAMKMMYPEMVRDMSSVLILVPSQSMPEARAILTACGSEHIVLSDSFWGKRALRPVIQECIEEAVTCSFLGVRVRVARAEDLVWLNLLQVGFSVLHNLTHQLPATLIDIRRLMRAGKGFDVDKLVLRIRQSGTGAMVGLVYALFAAYLPKELSNIAPLNSYPIKQYIGVRLRLLYNRAFRKGKAK